MFRRLRWSNRSARISDSARAFRRLSIEPLEARRMFAGIDMLGPTIVGVEVTGAPAYDLLSPHPDDGPTPQIESLTIRIEDGPDRFIGFDDEAVKVATAQSPANYRLVGDATGPVSITHVSVTNSAVTLLDPALATIELHFAIPLADDRYTLTIFDSIADPSGNALDGEANFVVPSGDGDPGGDFVTRFTVDSVAELGTWAAGSVYLDLNGNYVFDPHLGDPANRDAAVTLGFATDYIFAGNFAEGEEELANGFDKLASYGIEDGRYRWLINFNGQFDPFDVFTEPAGFNGTGMPVAGDFDGEPDNGDEIGLFTGTEWIFDTDHDFSLADQSRIASGLRGLPVVGDFDGDGLDDLATWDASTNTFFFSETGSGGGPTNAIETFRFRIGNGYQFSGVRERPVAGDLDGDGLDELGLFVPDRSGVPPDGVAEWYFFSARNANHFSVGVTDRLAPGQTVLNFVPEPFGTDIFAQFGNQHALPVIGNFGPPDGIEVPIPKQGDFNLDDVVDELDYNLWSSTFGSTTDLRADGNGNKVVDLADYTIWRDNFVVINMNTGTSVASAGDASTQASTASNEPASGVASKWTARDKAFEGLAASRGRAAVRGEAQHVGNINSELLLLLTPYVSTDEDEITALGGPGLHEDDEAARDEAELLACVTAPL